VWSYPINERTENTGIAIGDADNDGQNEIVVSLSWFGRKILMVEYSNGDYVVETIENTGGDINSIDVADVNGDNLNEIIAGTGWWATYDVRVLKYENGGFTRIWNEKIGWTQARVGDIDGDGKVEIATVSGNVCSYTSLSGVVLYYLQ